MTLSKINFTQTEAYQKLNLHYNQIKDIHLNELLFALHDESDDPTVTTESKEKPKQKDFLFRLSFDIDFASEKLCKTISIEAYNSSFVNGFTK